MQTLLQYLAALANDPAAQEAFKKDPETAIGAAQLSDQDKAVLRTRNNGFISAAVGAQAVAAMIYATPAPMIYAQQPGAPAAMIYAHPSMIYGQPPAPMIYAHPSMIYGQPPAPMIYAHPCPPAMIYAHGAPAAMIYGQPPAMIYGQPPAPTPPTPPTPPAMIYTPAAKPDAK